MAVFVFVVIGAVWLSRIDQVNIATVIIVGNSVITKAQLEQVVAEQLRGTYGLLFPRTNILFYPRNSITASVLKAFDRISDADLVVENPQTIKLTVKERQPFALYCGDTYIDTRDILGHCYFMDEKGIIFAKAPDFTGTIFFKYFGKTAAGAGGESREPLGLEYIPQDKFREVMRFLESFEELGMEPVSFTRLSEVDFEIRLKSGGYILFGGQQSLASVLDKLQSVFESDVFLEREGVQLDYVDLRFGNKVFYKFAE